MTQAVVPLITQYPYFSLPSFQRFNPFLTNYSPVGSQVTSVWGGRPGEAHSCNTRSECESATALVRFRCSAEKKDLIQTLMAIGIRLYQLQATGLIGRDTVNIHLVESIRAL